MEAPASTGSVRKNLRSLFALGLPNTAACLINFLNGLIASLFVGHLGEVYLGACVLGNMFGNVTGNALGLGLATALDSLGSQAYGAKHYGLVGLYTQRGMLISTIVFIPIFVIWSFAAELLVLVGIEEKTAAFAGEWIGWLRFACWPNFMYYMLVRFYQCQGIFWITTASCAVCVASNLMLTPALIYGVELGYKGAAIAQMLTYWVLLLSCWFFGWVRQVWVARRRKRAVHAEGVDQPVDNWVDPALLWPSPFRWAIFRGWGQFLRLGIPGAASLFVEWGSYEVTSMVAASLGDTPLAVHALFTTSANLNYAFPLGLSSAGAILIGQYLGAGSSDSARQLTLICVLCTGAYGILSGLLLIAIRVPYVMMFTSESGLISSASTDIWVLLPYFFMDHTKCTFMAILRSTGRPQITFYLSVVACWAVGFPVIYMLVYQPAQIGIVGIWLGMTSSWGACTLSFGGVLWRTNWQEQANNALRRNEAGNASNTDTITTPMVELA